MAVIAMVIQQSCLSYNSVIPCFNQLDGFLVLILFFFFFFPQQGNAHLALVLTNELLELGE